MNSRSEGKEAMYSSLSLASTALNAAMWASFKANAWRPVNPVASSENHPGSGCMQDHGGWRRAQPDLTDVGLNIPSAGDSKES